MENYTWKCGAILLPMNDQEAAIEPVFSDQKSRRLAGAGTPHGSDPEFDRAWRPGGLRFFILGFAFIRVIRGQPIASLRLGVPDFAFDPAPFDLAKDRPYPRTAKSSARASC